MGTLAQALCPLVPLALLAGCTQTRSTVLPYPIPLELSGPGGGLLARATVGGTTAPFPMVVDTGTILTTFDDGSGRVRALTGDLAVYGIDGTGAAIPRLSISDVQLFEGPLGALGVGAAATPVGGVLGGDNLSRVAVSFDYRGAAPTMTLTENLTGCNCELAPSCDRQDACYAVLPFTLAGGQDTTLQGQTRITIGQDQYTYPPTRVLLNACLEPLPDPVETHAVRAAGRHLPGQSGLRAVGPRRPAPRRQRLPRHGAVGERLRSPARRGRGGGAVGRSADDAAPRRSCRRRPGRRRRAGGADDAGQRSSRRQRRRLAAWRWCRARSRSSAPARRWRARGASGGRTSRRRRPTPTTSASIRGSARASTAASSTTRAPASAPAATTPSSAATRPTAPRSATTRATTRRRRRWSSSSRRCRSTSCPT